MEILVILSKMFRLVVKIFHIFDTDSLQLFVSWKRLDFLKNYDDISSVCYFYCRPIVTLT